MLRLSRAVSRSVSGSCLPERDVACVASLARLGVFDVLEAVFTGLLLAARGGCFDDATCSGFFAAAAVVVLSVRGGFAAATRADLVAGGTAMACAPMAANGVDCCCWEGDGVLSSTMRAVFDSGVAGAAAALAGGVVSGLDGAAGAASAGGAAFAGATAAMFIGASARFDCNW